jgi:hypothetical protein
MARAAGLSGRRTRLSLVATTGTLILVLISAHGDDHSTDNPAHESEALTPRELKRMRNVADRMLTSHARLRDRYRRRASFLTLLIIALSIAAASLAFAAGNSTVSFLFIHARLSRWVAISSLLIFFLGMADLHFDWRLRALEHDQAAIRLAELKQRLRTPQIHGNTVVQDDGVVAEYERTMSVIPPIPESQFASLKAHHAYKVALSQAVDTHPGAPMWYLRLLVRLHGARMVTAESSLKPGGPPDLEALDRGDVQRNGPEA